MGEDVLRPRQVGHLVQLLELVQRVLPQDAPVPRVGRRGVGLAEGAKERRLREDGRELVLAFVVEDAVGVDIRHRRRPPVRDVDVAVADLLEGCRHHEVIAQDAVDRLAVLALGGLRLECVGVEVVHVQRAAERQRRLDVVRVRVARDLEAALLEGGQEWLVVEVVDVAQGRRACVAVQDDVVDVGQIAGVWWLQLKRAEARVGGIHRAERDHGARHAPGVEQQGQRRNEIERARRRQGEPSGMPGGEEADADHEHPRHDQRPLAGQHAARRVPGMAVAEEADDGDRRQQPGPPPVPEREAEHDEHDVCPADGQTEGQPQGSQGDLLRGVDREQEDDRVCRGQQRVDRQRGPVEAQAPHPPPPSVRSISTKSYRCA